MARKATAPRSRRTVKGSGSSSLAAARRSLVGDRYRLEGTYERLRRAIASLPEDGRLDHPLSYWVLPSDRRLPIAFLDRNLRELLALPLADLMQTQGVGRKKILGFFDLLRRAHKAQAPHAPFGMFAEPGPATSPAAERGVGDEFDPAGVSEAVWSQWCEAIEHAGFADHRLGRVAPSLRPLPTVIWETPISAYSRHTLAEVRAMKTHGQKRIQAILGVFHAVYEAVSTAALHENLQLDVGSRRVAAVSRWVIDGAATPDRLTESGVRRRLERPLVDEIENDLGPEVASLVAERLGVDGPSPSVKRQAEQRSITRARVYQLLDDCARVMHVRWPEGRWLLASLCDESTPAPVAAATRLRAVRELFYPG